MKTLRGLVLLIGVVVGAGACDMHETAPIEAGAEPTVLAEARLVGEHHLGALNRFLVDLQQAKPTANKELGSLLDFAIESCAGYFAANAPLLDADQCSIQFRKVVQRSWAMKKSSGPNLISVASRAEGSDFTPEQLVFVDRIQGVLLETDWTQYDPDSGFSERILEIEDDAIEELGADAARPIAEMVEVGVGSSKFWSDHSDEMLVAVAAYYGLEVEMPVSKVAQPDLACQVASWFGFSCTQVIGTDVAFGTGAGLGCWITGAAVLSCTIGGAVGASVGDGILQVWNLLFGDA